MENNAVKKPRLEWLDALRGFTMIMVVANHVAGLGFGEEWNHSSAIPFLVLFRMPLFFFVSGFLAYKASQVWNLRNFGSLIWKKVKVQTIPTLVFFFLAIFANRSAAVLGSFVATTTVCSSVCLVNCSSVIVVFAC